MPLAVNNNRGSVYRGRMKIEVPKRECLTDFNLRPPDSKSGALNTRPSAFSLNEISILQTIVSRHRPISLSTPEYF